MLEFNDQAILDGSGTIRHEAMKEVAFERYGSFDENRKLRDAKDADADDLRQLEQLEDELKRKQQPPTSGTER